MRPGIACEEIELAWRRILSAHGIEKEAREGTVDAVGRLGDATEGLDVEIRIERGHPVNVTRICTTSTSRPPAAWKAGSASSRNAVRPAVW